MVQFEPDLENPDTRASLTRFAESGRTVSIFVTVYGEVNAVRMPRLRSQDRLVIDSDQRKTILSLISGVTLTSTIDVVAACRNNNFNQTTTPTSPAARTITIFPSSIDGEPGEEIEFTVISSPSMWLYWTVATWTTGTSRVLFGAGNVHCYADTSGRRRYVYLLRNESTPGYLQSK